MNPVIATRTSRINLVMRTQQAWRQRHGNDNLATTLPMKQVRAEQQGRAGAAAVIDSKPARMVEFKLPMVASDDFLLPFRRTIRTQFACTTKQSTRPRNRNIHPSIIMYPIVELLFLVTFFVMKVFMVVMHLLVEVVIDLVRIVLYIAAVMKEYYA